MNQLLHDICRCTSPTCHVRDLCARFMDSPAGPRTPYADLTNECQDIGAERMFIPHNPPITFISSNPESWLGA